jgi:hypothetical protein
MMSLGGWTPVEGATKAKDAFGCNDVPPDRFNPPGQPKDTQRFDQYEMLTYRTEDLEPSVEVKKRGRRIYARMCEGGKFLIAQLNESGTPRGRIAIGKDITGRGIPNLVLFEWSGGAHCCYTAHVFEIGQRFRKIAALNAQNGPLDFEDLDGDGVLEFVFKDWTFAYWRTSFNYSPAPRVVLRFRNGEYRMAPEFMRKPPAAEEWMKEKAQEVLKGDWTGERIPPELWNHMVDFIYTGNANQAWAFFDMAWRPGDPGKATFLRDFRRQLARSPYWPDIAAMNRAVK